jgi:hypothetical protein
LKQDIFLTLFICVLPLLPACGDSTAVDFGDCFIDDASGLVGNDGSLLLSGSDSLLMGEGNCNFSRICVSDQASLRVRGSTSMVINGQSRSVIGGMGIGPEGNDPATIRMDVEGPPEIYLLIENQNAQVNLVLNAADSNAWISITGQAGLVVDGEGAKLTTYGWDPTNPPGCE